MFENGVVTIPLENIHSSQVKDRKKCDSFCAYMYLWIDILVLQKHTYENVTCETQIRGRQSKQNTHMRNSSKEYCKRVAEEGKTFCLSGLEFLKFAKVTQSKVKQRKTHQKSIYEFRCFALISSRRKYVCVHCLFNVSFSSSSYFCLFSRCVC